MRLTHLRSRGFMLAALVPGCGGMDAGMTDGHTVVDSSGISIVTSTQPVWSDRAAVIDSTPILRLGSDDSGPLQFSFVWLGFLFADGGFVVAEGAVNEVRIFDASGRHLRTIGRSGDGPGEFRSLTGLFPVPGDSIVVHDQILGRATVIPLQGSEPRVIDARTLGNMSAFGALGTGDLLLYDPGSARMPGLPPGVQWTPTDVNLLALDGTSRTILQLPSRVREVQPDGYMRPVEPGLYAIHAASADGFYWATPDRYDIGFYTPDGALRRIVRRAVTPTPVTQPMIDAWIETQVAEQVRSEGPAAEARNRQRFAAMTFGDKVPLFSTAFVDDDGRLWVGEASWPSRGIAPRRWAVFRSDGVWLGDVEAPPDLRVLAVRSGLVLGVSQPEGEAPQVQVHRLTVP